MNGASCWITSTLTLWDSLRSPRPILLQLLQSGTGKYFAIADLVSMFCSVPISTASWLQFALPQRDRIYFYPAPMGYTSTALSSHTDFEGKILTTSCFLQEHGYAITLTTYSSEKIHLKHLLGIYKYKGAHKKWVGHSFNAAHHLPSLENYLVKWRSLQQGHCQETPTTSFRLFWVLENCFSFTNCT